MEDWKNAGLLYEVEEGVAWLRMNRPEKRNALDRPLRTALLAAIHEVSEDNAVRVAVIAANGPAFSSGADLTQPGGAIEIPPERRPPGPNLARSDGVLYGWFRLMEAIWHSETPFIAAVNGMAAGGGCQLALACDLIIASEEASFWEVFVRRGLPLEGGGAWILPRLVSLVRAKEMALFGEPLPARRAEEWGLINRWVPAAELEPTVREWAHKLATLAPPGGGPTMAGAPGAPRPYLSARAGHIKSQLNQSLEATMYQTFRDEVTLLALMPVAPPPRNQPGRRFASGVGVVAPVAPRDSGWKRRGRTSPRHNVTAPRPPGTTGGSVALEPRPATTSQPRGRQGHRL